MKFQKGNLQFIQWIFSPRLCQSRVNVHIHRHPGLLNVVFNRNKWATDDGSLCPMPTTIFKIVSCGSVNFQMDKLFLKHQEVLFFVFEGSFGKTAQFRKLLVLSSEWASHCNKVWEIMLRNDELVWKIQHSRVECAILTLLHIQSTKSVFLYQPSLNSDQQKHVINVSDSVFCFSSYIFRITFYELGCYQKFPQNRSNHNIFLANFYSGGWNNLRTPSPCIWLYFS